MIPIKWRFLAIVLLIIGFAAGGLGEEEVVVYAIEQEDNQQTNEQDSSNQDSLENIMEDMKEQWNQLDTILGQSQFDVLLKSVYADSGKGTVIRFVKLLRKGMVNQWEAERSNLIRLFILGVLSAFFVDYASGTLKNYMGETGYFAIYIGMLMVLMVDFGNLYQVAKDGVSVMFETVGAVIPIYLSALFMAGDYKTGIGMYTLVLSGIAGVEWLTKNVLFPICFFYFTLEMLNFSMKEDRFSKLASFMKQSVIWILRLLFGVITGLQVVQCLLLPVSDQAKNSNFSKSLAAIPGLGASARALTGTMLNSATVMKNGVGIAGMLALVMIVLLPAGKLLLFILAYQLLSAILQPVAHKRIAAMLLSVAQSGKLLLQGLITCTALYLVCIAMVTAATSTAL